MLHPQCLNVEQNAPIRHGEVVKRQTLKVVNLNEQRRVSPIKTTLSTLPTQFVALWHVQLENTTINAFGSKDQCRIH